jgi:hypothetical protein
VVSSEAMEEGKSPEDPETGGVPLRREELDKYPATILNNEGLKDREARVVAYDLPGSRVVLKEWKPKSGALIRWWSRRIIQREMRHYEALQGVRGIPRFLGRLDDRAFLIEYVEAQPIRRRLPRPLLEAGMKSLEGVLEGMHARRFVHLDLRNKGNILIDARGGAWVIDLQQGLDCSRGILRRLFFPLLKRFDEKAILKFRARYMPETLDASIRDRLVKKHCVRKTSWVPLFGNFLLNLMVKDGKSRLRFRARKRHRRPPCQTRDM